MIFPSGFPVSALIRARKGLMPIPPANCSSVVSTEDSRLGQSSYKEANPKIKDGRSTRLFDTDSQPSKAGDPRCSSERSQLAYFPFPSLLSSPKCRPRLDLFGLSPMAIDARLPKQDASCVLRVGSALSTRFVPISATEQ